MLQAAITSDIDTLASIYKGFGCRRPDGYTYAELEMGLENFARFLEPFGIQATLFMVGQDFIRPQHHEIIRTMAAAGHEIANHTHTHAQGFRLLTPVEKEAEIAQMETLCEQVTGQCPIGFRSPGWNISDDVLPILQKRGYLYDSSVFPTSLMPLLKFLHWRTTPNRKGGERTTMGLWRYMLAPTTPYRTSQRSLSQRGQDGIIEFPITVTPIVRLPFFATFLLATGIELFKVSYRVLKALKQPIQFQFHLSDFVDYNHPDFIDQVPSPRDGVYVPQALYLPLSKKLALFQKSLETIAQNYTFNTLAQWAMHSCPSTPRQQETVHDRK